MGGYVIYSFKYYLTFGANSTSFANSGVQLLIDNVVQSKPELVGTHQYADNYVTSNWTIAINGEPDSSTNITLNEWTNYKTLKLQARERASDRQGIIHTK